MKVLILCGVFSDAVEHEVLRDARSAVEFSANLMQKKIISAARETEHEVTVLSAPFLGAFPNASSRLFFRGFDTPCNEYTYVPFLNLWGVRNLSRAASLKRAMRKFLKEDGEKLILCYCPHTPFLKAAAHAKRRDKRIRTCLYVPDLPEYMNLSSHVSPIYKFAKFFDIRAMKRAMKQTDSFVLLTEQMKERLPIGEKPYLVSEGLVTKSALAAARKTPSTNTESTPDIVYTGKFDERFGCKTLIDAMKFLKKDCRLILCGTGDALPYAEEAAKKDPRIRVLGQVTPTEAKERQNSATVLVNPRAAQEEYTKYSFPSKNLEYLLTGHSVVAHCLDGMPDVYRSFLFTPSDGSACALAEALANALSAPEEKRRAAHRAFLDYAEENLLSNRVFEKILQMGI